MKRRMNSYTELSHALKYIISIVFIASIPNVDPERATPPAPAGGGPVRISS